MLESIDMMGAPIVFELLKLSLNLVTLKVTLLKDRKWQLRFSRSDFSWLLVVSCYLIN